MKPNETFLDFHTSLSGFDIYKNGRYIPKFIPYWAGVTSTEIITQTRNYKLRIKNGK
jgi:hypothetical protein